MRELEQEVSRICDQFMKEERGNRLSSFSMGALKAMLLGAISSCKVRIATQKEDKKDG